MITHGKQIISQSFYDGQVVSEMTEVESQQFIDRPLLLREVIDSLAVITGGQTSKLVIEISVDKRQRYKLTQRWRVQ